MITQGLADYLTRVLEDGRRAEVDGNEPSGLELTGIAAASTVGELMDWLKTLPSDMEVFGALEEPLALQRFHNKRVGSDFLLIINLP